MEDSDRWFKHFVSGVGGEGASSKRWRVWGSETGWPTMSASMRSTLQTVPESVPADHVTNSKVSTKTWGTPSPLRSCDRNCSFEDETAGRVLQKIVLVRDLCEHVFRSVRKGAWKCRECPFIGSYVRILFFFFSFIFLSERIKGNCTGTNTVAVSSIDNVPCHAKRVKGMVEGWTITFGGRRYVCGNRKRRNKIA